MTTRAVWIRMLDKQQKLHVTVMKMLRWACGITRLDKIQNTHMKELFKVDYEKYALRLRTCGSSRPGPHGTKSAELEKKKKERREEDPLLIYRGRLSTTIFYDR